VVIFNDMVILFIILFIFSILVSIYIDRSHKKKYLERLKITRKYLTDEEILNFYHNSEFSETSILELWHEVANNFDVPSGYLRPEDELVGMGIINFWGDHPKLEDISDIAIDRMKALNKQIDLQDISTLDDYIRALAGKK